MHWFMVSYDWQLDGETYHFCELKYYQELLDFCSALNQFPEKYKHVQIEPLGELDDF